MPIRHRHTGAVAVQLQSFVTSAPDRDRWSTPRFLSLDTQKGPRYTFNEAGFAPEPVLIFGEKKNLTLVGIRTPDSPARRLVAIPTKVHRTR